MVLDAKKTIENIFEIDRRIIEVGIGEVAGEDKLLGFKTRPGAVGRPSKTEMESAGLVLTPVVMMQITEKFQPFTGKVKRLSIRGERLLLVFYQAGSYLIGVGLEPQTESAILDKVGEAITATGANNERPAGRTVREDSQC